MVGSGAVARAVAKCKMKNTGTMMMTRKDSRLSLVKEQDIKEEMIVTTRGALNLLMVPHARDSESMMIGIM